EEGPDLAVVRLHQAAVLQIPHEACVVDRHQRAETHGNGRELPVVRHQPGMRIGGNALAADFLAEGAQRLFAEAAFKEGARVDARRGMALDVDEVAAILQRGAAPEMVEAHFIKLRGGGVAGDVVAELGALAVGMHLHRHRVPADVGLDALLDLAIAGVWRFLVHRDGVEVRGLCRVRKVRALTARMVDQLLQQEMRTGGAVGIQGRIQRLEPFLGFLGIDVLRRLELVFTNLGVIGHGLSLRTCPDWRSRHPQMCRPQCIGTWNRWARGTNGPGRTDMIVVWQFPVKATHPCNPLFPSPRNSMSISFPVHFPRRIWISSISCSSLPRKAMTRRSLQRPAWRSWQRGLPAATRKMSPCRWARGSSPSRGWLPMPPRSKCWTPHASGFQTRVCRAPRSLGSPSTMALRHVKPSSRR